MIDGNGSYVREGVLNVPEDEARNDCKVGKIAQSAMPVSPTSVACTEGLSSLSFGSRTVFSLDAYDRMYGAASEKLGGRSVEDELKKRGGSLIGKSAEEMSVLLEGIVNGISLSDYDKTYHVASEKLKGRSVEDELKKRGGSLIGKSAKEMFALLQEIADAS